MGRKSRPEPPDRLDELVDEWTPERPTANRIRRINEKGDSVTPPPSLRASVRGIQAWVQAHWWVLAIAGATGGTAGLSRLPWGDWLGLATKAELAQERAAREALRRTVTKQAQAVSSAQERAGRAADECAALRTQVAGADERLEAVEVKPKRSRPPRPQ